MLGPMAELPMIVSVDDHVVEPANVWMDRLPSKYKDVGPRIIRAPMGEITYIGGKLTAGAGELPDELWRAGHERGEGQEHSCGHRSRKRRR